jgi:hypothetical protein
LTLAFYPASYRQEKAQAHQDSASTVSSTTKDKDDTESFHLSDPDKRIRSKFTVVLNRLEHLPSVMSFIKLAAQPTPPWLVPTEKAATGKQIEAEAPPQNHHHLSVDALRLVELTERTSAVMKAAESEATARSDLLTNIFKTFASLNMIPVRDRMAIVSSDELSASVASFAIECETDLVVVPWNTGPSTRIEEEPAPFDHIFGRGSFGSADRYHQYAGFVRNVFAEAPVDVAVYLDQGSYSASFAAGARKHIFFAFSGGADDRLALELVVQFCRNPGVTATVVRIVRDDNAKDVIEEGEEELAPKESNAETLTENRPAVADAYASVSSPLDTIYQVRTKSGALVQ